MLIFTFILASTGVTGSSRFIGMAPDRSDFYTPPTTPKISVPVYNWLSGLPQGKQVKLWVYFTDKGILEEQEYKNTLQRLETSLKPEIKARRLLVRKERSLCDFSDIPVYKKYIDEIKGIDGKAGVGCKLEGISNWLNAVAFIVPVELVPDIAKKEYVRKIEPVRTLCANRDWEVPPTKGGIEYGDAEKQLKQINLTSAHKAGYTGKGVRIGFLDSGFEWRRHIGLQGIDVITEYDFINDDTCTAYEEGDDPEQIYHGTGMLCLVGGRKSGDYIGAAFNASFALAKTELLNKKDIIMEETWWIRGVEWLTDSIGVDIISNSLGYKNWVDGGNFAYDSLNGKHYPMEIVASMVWSKGTLLVTAMGNLDPKDPTTRPDTCIVAPASADSIIAVGGVDTLGHWNISMNAIGPRCDGARKPDVCAAWTGAYGLPLYYPDYTRDSTAWGTGTSIATALVAGACACVKEGHPDWGPMKIREAIRNTASLASSPNDTLGYGIVNAMEAIYYEPPESKDDWNKDKIIAFWPNPFRPGKGNLTIVYKLINNSSYVDIRVFTLSGKPVWNSILEDIPMGEKHTLQWDGKTAQGTFIASGIYICYLNTGYGYDVKKFAVVK